MLGDTWNHGESPERYPVDTGRLRRVAETAAQEAGWGKSMQQGYGMGIAAHYSFVSYIAAVVQVVVDAKGELTIPRIDVAVDCGACVYPDRVRAQMEGACVMGLGVAMLNEISFKDGRVQQDNYHAYEVTRITGAPREIHVHILPGDFGSPSAAWASLVCLRFPRRCSQDERNVFPPERHVLRSRPPVRGAAADVLVRCVPPALQARVVPLPYSRRVSLDAPASANQVRFKRVAAESARRAGAEAHPAHKRYG